MASTTTLKLPAKLKARIAALAKQSGQSPHHLMVEALERHAEREERMRVFIEEALASDRAIDKGQEVYAAAVHAWMKKLAVDPKAARPKSWRE